MKMSMRPEGGTDAFDNPSLYATPRQRVEVFGRKGILVENSSGSP